MDDTKEDLNLDIKELLDKLRTVDVNKSASSSADVSTNDACYDSSPYIYNNASDTITLSGSELTNGGSTILNPGGLTGSYGQVYTASSGLGGTYSNTSPWATSTGTASPWVTNTTLKGGQLELEGKDADIIIDGKSLLDTLAALEERLNLLVPNPEMEKEWDQLKRLGDRYRKLEKKLKEQSDMWNKLKSMPPPEIY